jgi:uncharacterized membrane protein (DUF4010 family)
MLIAAYLKDPAASEDPGTTTVIAALLVFGLGAINYFGYRLLAVSVGVGMTALLYFKAEIEGFSQRLTATDIRSMLQFAALSAVILPLLPDEPMGPYGVLNPFRLWLMVVLVAGVSLAGYVCLRFTRSDKGLLLTGLLGGTVSSTATTLVNARQANAALVPEITALVVIVLANAAMFVRLLLIVAVAGPALLVPVATVLVPALLLGIPAIAVWWKSARGAQSRPPEEYRNPTNLGTALVFGAAYAAVLVASAWLSQQLGSQGMYAAALVSGLTDVDAITLSSLQLAASRIIEPTVAATAIGLAVGSNLLFKTALVFGAGGRSIGRKVLAAFAGPLAGLAIGIAIVRDLAL